MRDWTNYFVKSTLRALKAIAPSAPAGDGGLREALEKLHDRLYATGNQVGKAIALELDTILEAHPAAPAEVVIDHRPGETCSVAAEVDPETGFARTPAVPQPPEVSTVDVSAVSPVDREALRVALEQALGLSKGVLATTHQNHGFDSGCPVCRGKSDAIAEAVVDDLLALLAGEQEQVEP
jgi:hypothetical protein